MLFDLETCCLSSVGQEVNERREFARFFDFTEENQGKLLADVNSWIEPIEDRLADLALIRRRREERNQVRQAKLQAESERDRLQAEGKDRGQRYIRS